MTTDVKLANKVLSLEKRIKIVEEEIKLWKELKQQEILKLKQENILNDKDEYDAFEDGPPY